jgi:hypothetical protein
MEWQEWRAPPIAKWPGLVNCVKQMQFIMQGSIVVACPLLDFATDAVATE